MATTDEHPDTDAASSAAATSVAASATTSAQAQPAVRVLLGGLIALPPLHRHIWLLSFVRFIVTAGFAVVMPFLAMHLAVDRQVPLLHIGALWAVSSGISAAMQWVAGSLADRLGRRRVFLSGMVVRSANLALLGYAISSHAAFPVIALLAVANGGLRAFYDPIAWALVATLSGKSERLAAFSVHRVGQSLGWVAGPLFATLAADASYGTLFYVCAPLTLLAPLAAAWIPDARVLTPSPARANNGLFAFAGDRRFMRFLGATFVYFILQTQMYHLLAVYAATHLALSRGEVGSLFTANAILVVLLQLPIVRYIARLGSTHALVFGSCAYLGAFIACGLAQGYPGLLGGVALLTLCEILTAPAQQARMTRLAPPDKMAAYGGAFGSFQGTAQAVGPALGVFLTESTGPRMAWLLLSLLGPVAAWLYRERR